MIYLSGVVHPKVAIPQKVGYMLTPNMGNRPDLSEIVWGADNGCYTKSGDFSLQNYLDWLEEFRRYLPTCLFATAPDLLGDAKATWWRSRDVLPMIRALGYQAALVAQDGIEWTEIEWDRFDVLFVGGTTAWKLSVLAEDVMKEAKANGKWVHMGRVNSYRRIKAAVWKHVDSADGTFLRPAPDVNVPKLHAWMERLEREPFLPEMSA